MCDSLNVRIGTVLNNLIIVYGIANRQSRIFVHTAKLCKEIRLRICHSRSCVGEIPFLKPWLARLQEMPKSLWRPGFFACGIFLFRLEILKWTHWNDRILLKLMEIAWKTMVLLEIVLSNFDTAAVLVDFVIYLSQFSLSDLFTVHSPK